MPVQSVSMRFRILFELGRIRHDTIALVVAVVAVAVAVVVVV